MSQRFIYEKSQIPKSYKKRIKRFSDLTDIQAIYYYERIKLEDRVERARKEGYFYELQERLSPSEITPYDIAEIQAITTKDIRSSGIIDREKEARQYLEDLIDYTLQKAEEAAQGWIELKRYKSKKNRGHISRGGEWLANNTRAAGDKIVNTIRRVMSDAEKSVQVYKYYLKGEKYQATRMEIERVLAASTTATGNYSDVNAFINEFELTPKPIDESINSDSLIDDNLSEGEFEE